MATHNRRWSSYRPGRATTRTWRWDAWESLKRGALRAGSSTGGNHLDSPARWLRSTSSADRSTAGAADRLTPIVAGLVALVPGVPAQRRRQPPVCNSATSSARWSPLASAANGLSADDLAARRPSAPTDRRTRQRH